MCHGWSGGHKLWAAGRERLPRRAGDTNRCQEQPISPESEKNPGTSTGPPGDKARETP